MAGMSCTKSKAKAGLSHHKRSAMTKRGGLHSHTTAKGACACGKSKVHHAKTGAHHAKTGALKATKKTAGKCK